jgi:hypothetical protein
MRTYRPGLALALLVVAAWLALTPPVAAQDCEAFGPRPVVCGLELELTRQGERARRIDADSRIQIPAGETVEIGVAGRDQNGRWFPEERFRFGLDVERACERDLDVEHREGDSSFRVTAGDQRGTCTIAVWIPGNLNLVFPLRIEVVSRARDGYSRAEAAYIAERLFAAILGRGADDAGLSAATTEIQRGRLESQVRGMFESTEYRSGSGRRSPDQQLAMFYQGLLGREPDTGGVRTYLDDIGRGRGASVVISIVRSEEFERQLFGKVKAD